MPINFPLSPSLNSTYTYLTKTWKWNSVAWEKVGGEGATGSTGATGAAGSNGTTGATGPVGDYVISWNGLTGAVDVTNSEILIGGVTLDGGGGATFAEVTVHGGITASGNIRGANFIVPDDGFIGVASNDDRIVFDTNLNTIAVRSDTVEIQRLLEHLGDSNTYLEFTTDDVAVQAGGNTFLHGTSTYAEFGGVTFAGGGATFAEVTVLGGITASGALYVGQGATFGGNITAPTFVGDLTGDVTGTSSVATVATTVTITDNESTAEDNAIIFAAGGDVDGGNLGLESDGTLTYNPSTGKVTTTQVDAAITASALNVGGYYALPTGAGGATGDVLMIANDGDLEFESLKTTASFIVDSDIPLATGIRYKGLYAVPFAKMDVTDIQLRSHDVSPAGSGDSLSVALKAIRRTSGLEAATPSIQFTVETVAIPLGGQYHHSINESEVDTPGVGADNAGMFLVVDVVSNAGNHTNFTMLVTMEARP